MDQKWTQRIYFIVTLWPLAKIKASESGVK